MRPSRSGQSVVELMLYISVVVVAIIAAAWAVFDPVLEAGFEEMKDNSTTVLSTGGTATGDRR